MEAVGTVFAMMSESMDFKVGGTLGETRGKHPHGSFSSAREPRRRQTLFGTDGERFDKMNNASVASLRARSASPRNAVCHPRNSHSSPEKHAGTRSFPAYKAGR